MKDDNLLRLGVIGCGGIMRLVYTPALQSLSQRARVAAVCDLNAAFAAESAGQFADAAVYADAKVMLREAALDAVLVLTSEKASARMARMVLEANLPVYLEKPPAVNSVELEELIAAETQSAVKVYTAFNRRHTPLFADLDFSKEKLRRVSGALKRLGRVVATFPLTSVHLIDSAQYFAGGLFKNWKMDFERKAENSVWTINGQLENGVGCALELVPDGKEFTEFLVLETDTATWELYFPNTEALVREGELTVRPRDGSPATIMRGQKAMPFFEAMGFRDSLQAFFRQLEDGKKSIHRLFSCRSTIAIMEEMEALVRS
jgi:virulence factor